LCVGDRPGPPSGLPPRPIQRNAGGSDPSSTVRFTK
jgi:hypothetical protein